MCRCTPNIRTPFCGKPGCEWPAGVLEAAADKMSIDATNRALEAAAVKLDQRGSHKAAEHVRAQKL